MCKAGRVGQSSEAWQLMAVPFMDRGEETGDYFWDDDADEARPEK